MTIKERHTYPNIAKLSREVYLKPSEQLPRRRVTKRLARLDAGFEKSGDQERLVWPEQEKDFQVWLDVLKVIARTAKQSDENFRNQTLPELIELIEASPMFQKLKQVEATQSAETVTHVFEGVGKLDTDLLGPLEVVETRFAHIFHDVGKVFFIRAKHYLDGTTSPIDRPDKKHLHGLMSAEMIQAFFDEHRDEVLAILQQARLVTTEEDLEEFEAVVYHTDRLHHMAEQLSMPDPRFGIEEIINSLEQIEGLSGDFIYKNLLPVLTTVTMADTLSVRTYEHFAWENAYWLGEMIFIQIFRSLPKASTSYEDLMLVVEYVKEKLSRHWARLLEIAHSNPDLPINKGDRLERYQKQFVKLSSDFSRLKTSLNTGVPRGLNQRGGTDVPIVMGGNSTNISNPS